MKKATLTLLTTLALISCKEKELPSLGDQTQTVFDNEVICFNPDLYPNGYNADKDPNTLRLVNGRIVLKKIKMPEYKRDVNVEAEITVQSNGDRWDKSGSCFIIPANSQINMIEVAKGTAKYPAVDSTLYQKLVGIVNGENYIPTVEIMRFMTPFGVGHYSKDTLSYPKRMPVFVDGWAENVSWKQDITDLYGMMTDSVWVGIYIDSWDKNGYKASVKFNFDENKAPSFPMKPKKVEPLINTVYYVGQTYPAIFADQDVKVDFDVPANAKNVELKYIVTGHGGHSGGDEFVRRENILSIDGDTVYQFVPWRTDCATFRRYNPTSGVWLRGRTAAYIDSKKGGYAEKNIEETIASSDLSRSNWCPGSDVAPQVIELSDIKPGKHTFTISIPEAQPMDGDKMNHWLVSAYLTWEE